MPTHGHIPSAGLESWLARGDADDQEHTGSSTARLGASATVLRGRVRLALPRGFLVRWHRAEIPARAQREDTLRHPIADVERQLIAGTDRARVASATVLLSLGPEAVRAMPSVLAALGDRQQQVRWRAVEIMRLVGPPPEALPRLIEALQSDACRSVRWRAAEALGARSLPAEACARALIEAAQDADEWVRWHADRVVAQVIDRSTVHDLLPTYASSPIPAIRAYAIGLLAHMDTIDKRLIDALAENLWHPVDAVRTKTLEFLLRHCPRAHPQVMRGVRLCLEHQHRG